MPPRFSLQPVLDYRHNVVESLEVQLGQLFFQREREQQLLEEFEGNRLALLDKLYACQLGEVDLHTSAQLRANIKFVNDEIEQVQIRIVELELKIQEKRRQIIEAKQDEEILLKLKEKIVEEFEQEQNRKEIQMQDDIYIAQAHQRAATV